MATTLKVTLALPYGDHQADDTVELDANIARELVLTGRARVAETKAQATPAPKTSAQKAQA